MKYLSFLLLLASAFAQTDGPAMLPQRTPLTVITSPNTPKVVGPSDNLQTAINNAVAGDTLLVDPLLQWTGPLTSPLREPCDPANGITIKRAGTLQLDQYNRPVPGQPMPKIILRGNQTAKFGNCTQVQGFEILRQSGTGTVYNLVTFDKGTHGVIFDSIYFHGTPTDETVHGISLGGSRDVTIRNSVGTEFHCKAGGTCGDAQAILGGTGDLEDSGNYLIENNYLQASGENIMFGGGGDEFCPTDITVQYNDLEKPDTWNPGSPVFAGIKWITKNLFELKNGCRILVQGNRMQGSWGGYTQLGWGILVGAKNQAGECAACSVVDITFRYNWISKTGQSMQIMFIADGTGLHYAKEEARISIHDIIFDNQQYPECYQCGQWMIQLSTDPKNPGVMHDVLIQNVSIYVSNWNRQGGFLSMGGPATGQRMYNIQFINNLFPGGKYPVYSVGGGTANCATGNILDYAGMFTRCWGGTSQFTSNTVYVNGNSSKMVWPSGNDIITAGANIDLIQSMMKAGMQ